MCVSECGERLSNSDKRFIRELLLAYWDSMLFRLAVVRLFVADVKDFEDDPMEILLTQPFVDLVTKMLVDQSGECYYPWFRTRFRPFSVFFCPYFFETI